MTYSYFISIAIDSGFRNFEFRNKKKIRTFKDLMEVSNKLQEELGNNNICILFYKEIESK